MYTFRRTGTSLAASHMSYRIPARSLICFSQHGTPGRRADRESAPGGVLRNRALPLNPASTRQRRAATGNRNSIWRSVRVPFARFQAPISTEPSPAGITTLGSEGHWLTGCAEFNFRAKSFPLKNFEKEDNAVRLAETSTLYSSCHRMPGTLYQILYLRPFSDLHLFEHPDF